jgi:hypothetical protein
MKTNFFKKNKLKELNKNKMRIKLKFYRKNIGKSFQKIIKNLNFYLKYIKRSY